MDRFDAISISKWPDRKRAVLTVIDGNRHVVLAYFINDEAVQTFLDLMDEASRRGIRIKHAEEAAHA